MQPLVREIRTRLSAYEAFCLFRQKASVAFLESRPGYGDLGRYSILGINPWLTLRGWPGHCLLNSRPFAEADGVDGVEAIDASPLDILDRLLLENQIQPVPGLPLVGGCIGAIAYDAGFDLVDLPLPERAEQSAGAARPLISFDFYDNFLIYDHQSGLVRAQACGRLEPAEISLDRLCRQIAAAEETALLEGEMIVSAAKPDCQPVIQLPDHLEYLAKVDAIRELIRQGEVYIANLTHLLTTSTQESAELLYERLRRLNPAPFAAFVRQGGLEILSASPERLMQIRHQEVTTSSANIGLGQSRRAIETRPIKGTRPRGRDAAEDELNAKILQASEKDKSELLMIVDLERNDLSRICRPESVAVPELFRLETFPTVFHLVATVQGILKEDISVVDCLRAIFPGGSITGAPKVAAMQIIDRLESQPRYLYTGCLGYISFDGQADFNILIRTLVKQGPDISYGSGGGITWESVAEEEYQEMLVKAKSFRQVMNGEVAGHAVD